MEEPSLNGPSWDHDPSAREWVPQNNDVTPRASKATWDWLCGNAPSHQEGEHTSNPRVAGDFYGCFERLLVITADDRDVGTLMAGLGGSVSKRAICRCLWFVGLF